MKTLITRLIKGTQTMRNPLKSLLAIFFQSQSLVLTSVSKGTPNTK